MGALRLAVEAERDLDAIAQYSIETWGPARAARYLADLKNCCQGIAIQPLLGRSCERILSGLRRIEQGRHTIFYIVQGRDVLVVRILHQSMLPERWIGHEEE